MRPNITDLFVLALDEPYLVPALFVAMQFASGPVYLWSGYQPTILNGQTYIGAGSLLGISTIEDGSDAHARGIEITLSGIDPNLLGLALNEFQIGVPVTVTLGLFSGPGQSLVNAPVVAWAGVTDQPTIDVDEKTATITIACESLLLRMNTPVAFRYTNIDQQLFYPGDTGFAWVTPIQSIPIYWNQTATSSGNP